MYAFFSFRFLAHCLIEIKKTVYEQCVLVISVESMEAPKEKRNCDFYVTVQYLTILTFYCNS